MPQPAAREGDPVTGQDTHIVLVPAPGGGTAPVPQLLAFSGTLVSGLSPDVLVNGRAAATVGSTARNTLPHQPLPPGLRFVKQPADEGRVQTGSPTVLVNGKPLARGQDQVVTCFDVPGPPSLITGGSPNVVVA
ncbi:PAAR domain-containing protein [Streptomyces sp. NRRL S-118]|uniref:PAAR domain-containing protein n=1 Tax=Streptomyces sp. NRRL S-118 TaxID=1463881 RepID=UPI0004C789EE|nr:PAAR domain-containing protein [Streptomyces sp. NRRL S-118]